MKTHIIYIWLLTQVFKLKAAHAAAFTGLQLVPGSQGYVTCEVASEKFSSGCIGVDWVGCVGLIRAFMGLEFVPGSQRYVMNESYVRRVTCR